jgi:HEAT repeat protein
MRTMNVTYVLILSLLFTCAAATQPASVSPRCRPARVVATAAESFAPAVPMEPASAFALAQRGAVLAGERSLAFFDGDDQDDPAYSLYKAGYKLILEEKWQEARKKLADVMSKYSKSKYVDDAQYWIAYSWKQSDYKKAIEVYKKFLKDYPNSNYYDDALADLNRLEHPEGVPGGVPAVAPYIVAAPIAAVPPVSTMVPPAAVLSRAVPLVPQDSEDPELRMKIEALYALTRGKSDEKTFELLKGIVLDKEQPRDMREAALAALRNQKDRDVTDVFVRILKTESDERLKATAIYWLGQHASEEKEGGEKAFELLKGIVLDKEQPREMREAALAALRNQKDRDVTDVFVQILKSESDEKLKATAIYWLGQRTAEENVGDEKTVALLKETAQDRSQPRDVRDAALRSLAMMNRPGSLDFFVQVAKNDPDKRVRQTALYAISQTARFDEQKAYQVMKEFALDQKQDPEMRESAFYWIRSFKKGDALDLYLQIAKGDPNVRMRSAALYYIGEAGRKDPDQVFKIYKEFLLDPTQPREVREAVMYSLTRMKTDEAFDLLLHVAKTDPDQRFQEAAIYSIGRMTKDKAKTLGTLTSLFESIPKDRVQTLNALLFSIANIGTDQAVEFLAKVAKTNENFELRRTAIYHLGNIGGEKARAALYDILKGK